MARKTTASNAITRAPVELSMPDVSHPIRLACFTTYGEIASQINPQLATPAPSNPTHINHLSLGTACSNLYATAPVASAGPSATTFPNPCVIA